MSPPKKNDPRRKGYNAANLKNFIKQVREEENKYKSKKNANNKKTKNSAMNKALRTAYSATSKKNLITQVEKKAGVRK